ncbi:MAG: hypothetical protein AB7J35_04045 [Dehalococcoidia bacterium]
MEFKAIEVGIDYAIRLRVTVGEPFIRVRALEKVQRNHQVKVRHLDEPHVGMEEFLPQRNFIAPWKEAKAFLRDEQRMTAVLNRSAEIYDRVTVETLQIIFESSGETDINVHSGGRVTGGRAAMERFAARAGMAPPFESIDGTAFLDRHGEYHMSLIGGEKLARAFALAEPDAVTLWVETHEAELLAQGYGPGDRFWHDYLRKQRPSYALARQWAGIETELNRLNKEIERLHNILEMAISDLRAAGLPSNANRLQRIVDGR